MRHSQLILGVLFSCSLLFAACSPAQQTEQEPAAVESKQATTGQPTIESVVAETPDTPEGTRQLEIEAFKFGYSSDQLTVKAGETITLTLSNTDGFHDFVIDELDVATAQINQGQTDTVTFTVPEDAAGKTFEYYCSVGNHRQLGMVGTLIVE